YIERATDAAGHPKSFVTETGDFFRLWTFLFFVLSAAFGLSFFRPLPLAFFFTLTFFGVTTLGFVLFERLFPELTRANITGPFFRGGDVQDDRVNRSR